MPAGRPSKFAEVDIDLVRELALQGKTDEEIAAELHVSRSTLSLWKARHEEFSDALKSWKGDADDAVELSLYRKALAGDTTAAIFWLKNRRANDWRDKQEFGHTVTSTVTHIHLVGVTPAEREPVPVYELVGE